MRAGRPQAGLRAAIAKLRAGGETVACVLPGHEHEVDEFDCDRELTSVAGQWQVQPLVGLNQAATLNPATNP